MKQYLKIMASILTEMKKEGMSSKDEYELCKCIRDNWLDDSSIEPQHLFNKDWLWGDWIPTNKDAIHD